MKKAEVSNLLNEIRGYYNMQFSIDEYVIDAWLESMKPYDYEDAKQHLQEYLKEFPTTPPRPHTFKNGLYTPEEKEQMKNTNYTIQCNLCGRWMSLKAYDEHYGRCLDIQYLLSIAKQKGEKYTREDLENCRPAVIDKLLEKYPPKKISLDSVLKKI